MDIAVPQMEAWLFDNGTNPRVRQGASYIPHPGIGYLRKVVDFHTPKNYIYFKDLECFKNIDESKKSHAKYQPNYYFDLDRLPANLIPEMKQFIHYRGSCISFSSVEEDRKAYTYVADFLMESYRNAKSFCEIDEEKCTKKLKAFLMKNGYPITYARKTRCYSTTKIINHMAINYLARIFTYFSKDDGLFHFEDDTWYLDRLDFPVKSSPIHNVKTIRFKDIAQETMKNEIKSAVLFRLRQVAVSTARTDISAITAFCNFLEKAYPEILSLTEIDREVLESYLLYINTEDTRLNNYHTELVHLKSFMYALGMTTEELTLTRLFLPDDIPKRNIPIYTFYTDNEIRTLNKGFKTLDPQFGRLMILHEILGCRIPCTPLVTYCISMEDSRW